MDSPRYRAGKKILKVKLIRRKPIGRIYDGKFVMGYRPIPNTNLRKYRLFWRIKRIRPVPSLSAVPISKMSVTLFPLTNK